MDLASILSAVVFAAVALGFLYAAKLWLDKGTRFDDDYEVEEKSNLAVALRRSGFYLAMALALAGALFKTEHTLLQRLATFALDGIVAALILWCIRVVNSRVILGGINTDIEVENGNVAVGLTEGGAMLSAGLILYASFTGEGGGVLSAVVFSALGEAALLGSFLLFRAWLRIGIYKELMARNTAAAVAVNGELLSLAIILMASIAGPFVSWAADLISFAESAAFGIILLLAVRTIGDWLFLPHTTIGTEIGRDRNTAAMALVEGVTIATAIIVAAAL